MSSMQSIQFVYKSKYSIFKLTKMSDYKSFAPDRSITSAMWWPVAGIRLLHKSRPINQVQCVFITRKQLIDQSVLL